MLKNIRKIVAVLFFFGLLYLFVDKFTGADAWLGWMAKLQFVPALMSLNFVVLVALLVLTLLFGRVYCSFVCPLGGSCGHIQGR